MNIGNHISLKDIVKYYNVHSLEVPIQIFTGSPLSFHRKEINLENCEECKILLKKIHLYVHSSYVINLGSKMESGETGSKSLIYVKKDLKISNEINARGLVIHVSRANKKNRDIATKDMYNSIINILEYLNEHNLKTKLLLETPAGQGTELLTTVEEFVAFCKLIKESKYGHLFGIVVDTCHVFSLGYEPDYYIKCLLEIGLKIDLVHLNDSMTSKGSKIDRHAKIFTGKIGKDSLNNCIKICSSKGIDMVYEVT